MTAVRSFSTHIRNSRQQSESMKDEHDKPSMTVSRNLLKAPSRLCDRKSTQSNVATKDSWNMRKEQVRLKCELKLKKFYKVKGDTCVQGNSNFHKPQIERKTFLSDKWDTEHQLQRNCNQQEINERNVVQEQDSQRCRAAEEQEAVLRVQV